MAVPQIFFKDTMNSVISPSKFRAGVQIRVRTVSHVGHVGSFCPVLKASTLLPKIMLTGG